MKTIYAITHSPRFMRSERHYNLSSLKRNRLEWEEYKRSEVSYLLTQIVRAHISDEPRPLALPIALLIQVWEKPGSANDTTTLQVHLDKVETMEIRSYEYDE